MTEKENCSYGIQMQMQLKRGYTFYFLLPTAIFNEHLLLLQIMQHVLNICHQ